MKANNAVQATACEQLRAAFQPKTVTNAQVCRFAGVDGYDVYNPSAPFRLNGKRYIAGRVEKRSDERSHVRFFEEREGVFYPVESTILALQDPFVCEIDGEVILGGVQVEYFPDHCIWTTEFYRMKSLQDIELLVRGPKLMKDIRLVQLADGRIGVFTRPQGQRMLEEYGCVAKIGFTIVNTLQELTPELMENAPLLEGQFLPEEWGGCNQITLLKNGRLGVIGHIACRTYVGDEQRLHYCGMAFCLDPATKETTPVKIVVTRGCFPDAPAKRPDLTDVTFTAGIERRPDGKAIVWSGLSDAHVGCAEIDDPFLAWEK